MRTLLANVGMLVCSGTLLGSGFAHLRRLGRFKLVISEHGLWPRTTEWVIVGAGTCVELALGIWGLRASLFGGDPLALVTLSVSTGGLFLSYAAYTLYLPSRRPGVPCGCGLAEDRVSGWVPVRAAALAGLALLALVGVPAKMGLVTLTAPRAAVVASAAGAIAVLIWTLPAVMANQSAETSQPASLLQYGRTS